MDVKTSRKFASFIEDEMFETEQRNALLRDIRGGAFAPGKISAPFMTLRISLHAIDAPQTVMDRLQSLETSAVVPCGTITDDMIAEARAAAARMAASGVSTAFVPPTLDDDQRDDAEESAADMLLPDSAFIDARIADSERQTERLVRSLQSGELTADFELKCGDDDAIPQ